MNKIKCPNCQTEFSLDDAVRSDIEQKVLAEKSQEIESNAKAKFEAELAAKQAEMQNKVEVEKQAEIEKMKKDSESEILKFKENTEKMYSQRIDDERKKAEEQNSVLNRTISTLQSTIENLNISISENQTKALNLENQLRLKEIEKQNEVNAKVKEFSDQLNASYETKLSQKDMKVLELESSSLELKKQIFEMQRKLELGSQQSQGEAQEIMLERLLKDLFPSDKILEVPKGVNGADCIQVVMNQDGKECGKIIFESKNTKEFNKAWPTKLKDDAIIAKAGMMVLVTQTLPKEIEGFGIVEGIWVTDFRSVKKVVPLLREHAISLASVFESNNGKDEKMTALYDYMTGNDFKARMERTLKSIFNQKSSNQRDFRNAELRFKERDKELDSMLKNLYGVHNDVKLIAGGAIPELASAEKLALPEKN